MPNTNKAGYLWASRYSQLLSSDLSQATSIYIGQI